MIDHNREEREALIEKARVAYTEAWEAEDRYLTTNNHPKTGHQRSRAGIVAALAVFEQAHAPTSDEREALLSVVINAAESGDALHVAEAERVRDAVLDAGFRRTMQGEPSRRGTAEALGFREAYRSSPPR